MSRLEIARAYGQSASERNKRKGGNQSKEKESVRRTRSAGDTLCSKSTPENLVIQDNSGMFSSKVRRLDCEQHTFSMALRKTIFHFMCHIFQINNFKLHRLLYLVLLPLNGF